MEERQAIARRQRGDLIGLEVLVKSYQVQAVHAAALIFQDKAIAEDIVQDAFITAAERIHQFDPERPFSPWFFRIVVNASIKAAERQSQLVALEDKQEVDDVTLGDLLADPQPQPDESFEQEEVRSGSIGCLGSFKARRMGTTFPISADQHTAAGGLGCCWRTLTGLDGGTPTPSSWF
jgi:RNA polymerase sigma-70 factor (ECF subfamily)